MNNEIYNVAIRFLMRMNSDKVFRVVMILIVCDCFFGTLRAVRQRKINSAIGIDGVIRKVGMIAAMCFLPVVDYLTGFNLIGFIPDSILEYLPFENVGIADFFGLLFIAYEAMSNLKNMYLSGMPVGFVWLKVDSFLRKYTNELPDLDISTEEQLKVIANDISQINQHLQTRDSE